MKSDRAVNIITVTISNGEGIVQECSMVAPLSSLRSFCLQQFLTEPNDVQLGFLDPAALPAGEYNFTCTAVSTTGKTVTFETRFVQ